MRSENLYLADIAQAADAIGRFLHEVERDEFLEDELRQSAVLQKLSVIGEAASHISAALRAAHPEIEWRDVIGFRNFAVHTYFSVNWGVVWITATQDTPTLRSQIVAILEELANNQDERP